MNKIILRVKIQEGFRMDTKKINIVCYADDVLLITENDNDPATADI